ncbi:hypothetical protein BD410DRAFT_794352 [Rickenella mellea]|uniref:Uncharacterized protein n=1 Tax=Rickenella mellea TaxID=50990 RepID=A0A4Y7PPM9_9AGAM|nr:hypothetical protein BD410DRAFT_794352 [Rickenella mellea]
MSSFHEIRYHRSDKYPLPRDKTLKQLLPAPIMHVLRDDFFHWVKFALMYLSTKHLYDEPLH